ncbi:hypothetical protein GQ457_16G021110 [Hibiscus cannabinus]
MEKTIWEILLLKVMKHFFYSITSKAYKVFNKKKFSCRRVNACGFDDNLLLMKDSYDDDVGILKANGGEQSSKVDEMPSREEEQDPALEALKDMPLEEMEVTYQREFIYVKGCEIFGDSSKEVTTRASLRNTCNYVAFISCIKPKISKKH